MTFYINLSLMVLYISSGSTPPVVWFQLDSAGQLARLVLTVVNHTLMTNLCLDAVRCKSPDIPAGM